jgi:hypothetical protein
MILTDYYMLERLPEFLKNRTPRFDCTASTGEYPPFEDIASKSRVKRFFCYFNGLPNSFSENARNKAERCITNTKNISSVFIPILNKHWLGYGDVKGTQDALLFVFLWDYSRMEIFVARGHKNNQKRLFNLLYDNELMEEMDKLRNRTVNLVNSK